MDGINFINSFDARNNAIFNNNMAAAQANTNAIITASAYDPWASTGGFGAQTDYYSALGASYGRAVGEATYPGYGPREGVTTQQPDYSAYQPEQAFNPQGGAGGYTPTTSYVPEQAFSPGGDDGYYSYDINGSPSWVTGGGAASAAASGQGNVYGGGGASAAAAYNPFDQYANGGYNPFSQQTYQPAAQQNVGGGGGGGAYGGYESLWDQQTAAQGGGGGNDLIFDGVSFVRGGGGSFADRFGGAEQPQLPNAITEGGYPTWDQRWDQIGDPYTNVPLNNALWQRGMDAGPQQPSGGAYGGYESLWEQQTAAQGGGDGHYETSYGYDGSPSTQWVPGGGAQGGGSDYNPFQQYQSGGYNPFASSYENDLNQILQGIGQGAGGGQQNYPSSQPPGDTLTPDDRGGHYEQSYTIDGGVNNVWVPDGGGGSGPYGGYESLWEQQTANDARSAATAAIMAQGGDGMADYQSPANDYNTFQQGSSTPAWQRAIPPERSSPELISAIDSLSQQYGWSPAAMAAIINMESVFNPLQATGSYRGLTQMGPKTFAEAGGTLNGLTWEDYQKATPAQQVATYGAWIDHYAKGNPNNAASLVKGGIGSLPPEMQAAIMQATQFGPNSTDWVRALAEGNMSVPTTPYTQADALKPYTIEAMRNEFERRMQGW
jgi:hypothetical protein